MTFFLTRNLIAGFSFLPLKCGHLQALFCFKKANYSNRITESQAYLYEQDGRTCRAASDSDGFSDNYEKAIEPFLKIGLIREAAHCLESLERYERLASTFFQRRQLYSLVLRSF